MRILLIQPKMNKRPMDTDLKTRMSPSLALLTLLNLTPDGHETTIINENVEKIDFDCRATFGCTDSFTLSKILSAAIPKLKRNVNHFCYSIYSIANLEGLLR